jgi:predicted DNA-binding transcriptional regulator YafY
LCEAGVPVVATPGYGYTLAPGYFLPPLMLTPEEAGMLLLGAAFVADQVDAPYKQAVGTARKKIEKLLPEATRREVEFLQDSLRFASFARADATIAARLTLIQRAIREREVLHLVYHARHGEPGERDVEPHGLLHAQGTWMMAAYCRVRAGMRNFRLDRIDRLTPTGAEFTRREDFSMRTVPQMRYGAEEVQALFTPGAARWARETLHYSYLREEPHPSGVLMIFAPRDLQDLLPWLLSWGPEVQVLAPPAARRQVWIAAQATAAQYRDEE